MENVVTELTTSLSPSAVWGVIGSVVPFMASLVLVGLGFYLIKRAMKKVQKGKGA